MVLPDLPISLTFGSLIALSNRGATPAPDWAARSFRQTLLYGLLINCPDSLSAFYFYPDWNLAYVLPWSSVGWGGAFLVQAALLASLLLGCGLTVTAGRKEIGYGWFVAGTGFTAFLGTFLAVLSRYLVVGDFDAYHNGYAVPIFKDAAFQAFSTLAGLYLILPLALLLYANWKRAYYRPQNTPPAAAL